MVYIWDIMRYYVIFCCTSAWAWVWKSFWLCLQLSVMLRYKMPHFYFRPDESICRYLFWLACHWACAKTFDFCQPTSQILSHFSTPDWWWCNVAEKLMFSDSRCLWHKRTPSYGPQAVRCSEAEKQTGSFRLVNLSFQAFHQTVFYPGFRMWSKGKKVGGAFIRSIPLSS